MYPFILAFTLQWSFVVCKIKELDKLMIFPVDIKRVKEPVESGYKNITAPERL